MAQGCTFGQGFLFSPAVPAAEVAQLVRTRARRAA
jgi:EAL domain-containing protein (putative c-di-GMP-specific phosphodiesterase class I)